MTSANRDVEDSIAKTPRVSLCVIVKNEEARLPTCLRSAADLVDEIIVVDTGSTDRSREIALEFGARVFQFPWVADFSAARNEALRHATGKWIFWLDADDSVDEMNRQRLRTLFARLGDENEGWLMQCLCVVDPRTDAVALVEHARLFRNLPEIRWQYPVHEQIVPSIMRQGGQLRRSDIVIHHAGYASPEQLRSKNERNLHILERAVSEQPNDPFILFCLGWTWYALGRITESIAPLRRSLEVGGSATETAAKVYSLLVQGYRQLNQEQEAWTVCQQGRAMHPDDPELLNQEALLRYGRGDLEGAEACLRWLLQDGPQTRLALGVDPGLWGYRTRYKLGVIYRTQGKLPEAEAEWKAALAERPEHTPSWIALADLWLSQGRLTELDTAAAGLERDSQQGEAAALLRATFYQAQNRFVAARRLLEVQLAALPQSPWLRLGLSSALMLEGKDLHVAEKLLEEVLVVDPVNEDAREGLAELQRRKFGGRRKRR